MPTAQRPAARSRSTGNLPAELTSFVGRRKLVQDAKAALSATRLLTLVGPGGVGKTRLALRVAADLQRAVPDGVWLVELAGLHEPGLLAKAVITALGLRDQSGDWAERLLVDYVADRNLLLLLDNCEHLVDACGTLVAALLREAPQLRVLATSRQPLDVVGERLLPVTPLPVPNGNGEATWEIVAQSEAVTLLTERASAATGDFAVSDDNREAVVELVRRLDGMPLAIELAAGRLRSLGVRQIVERLDDRFQLLATGPRALPERQRSLRSAIDWSYELLDDRERAVLHRLSVFAGSFGLDAAEAVCTSSALQRAAVVDVIAELVDRSFVQRSGTTSEARYRLHETMREYAAERLRESGELNAVADTYVEYYAGAVADSHREWPTARVLDWLRWMELESDNVRNMLEHCLAAPQHRHLGVRVVGDLVWYWVIRALTEGAHWIDRFLPSPGAPDNLVGRAHLARGYVAFCQADLPLAREELAKAATLLADADAGDRVFLLVVQSMTELMDVNVAGARRIADAAVGLASSLDDPLAMCRAHLADGRTAIIEGDAERGYAACLECARLARAGGDLHSLGFGLASAGMGAVALKRFDEGARLLDEGIRLGRQLDDRLGLLLRLEAQVSLLSGMGELERAARLIGVTRTLHRDTGGQMHSPARAWIAEAERLGRQSLGDRRFETLRSEGEMLDLQAAVAFALGEREKSAVGTATPAHARSSSSSGAKADGVLGRREREVAALVAEGLSNKEIATRLFLSERTVETHVYNILNKLGFNSRVQIATWAEESR